LRVASGGHASGVPDGALAQRAFGVHCAVRPAVAPLPFELQRERRWDRRRADGMGLPSVYLPVHQSDGARLIPPLDLLQGGG